MTTGGRSIRRAVHPLAMAAGAVAVLAALPPARVDAQGIDRSKPPVLSPPADLVVPAVRSATLANGLKLHVVEMHELPVVQIVLSVAGGGRLDGERPGLASFTANMLDEGAGKRDAFGIAAEAEFLGAQLATGATWDDITVSLRVPRRNLNPALDLMSDVVLRPTFAAAEVARQRDLRLANILQQRDQPQQMASLAFNAIVFPEGHPYHRPLSGDSAATAALDSAIVRQFYDRAFAPSRTTVLITGDITLADAKRELEKRFGAWRAGTAAAAAAPVTAEAPPISARAVYLVDKPGAAQSVITIGAPGVERSNPDYYAIEVMNTILGGSFSSRLNTNLRETKGYTYDARSGFTYRPLPGPFIAQAAVRTDVTDSSLVEFFKELEAIREAPVDSVELARAKAYLALGVAGDFETTRDVASRFGALLTFGLPLDYYNGYVSKIMAVTAADVQRVARKYITPDRLAVVVVGDVARIQPGIEALNLGPISRRNLEGKEVR